MRDFIVDEWHKKNFIFFKKREAKHEFLSGDFRTEENLIFLRENSKEAGDSNSSFTAVSVFF